MVKTLINTLQPGNGMGEWLAKKKEEVSSFKGMYSESRSNLFSLE